MRCWGMLLALVVFGTSVPAAASSNYTAQAAAIHGYCTGAELYHDQHGVYPTTDAQSTWYQKLIAGGFAVRPRFGTTAGGALPLDMYGRPLIYEPPSPGNNDQVVIRSVGANGVDEYGASDDLDSRFGPNWGHWWKRKWPANLRRAKVCAALAPLGLLALFLRRWPIRARVGLVLVWVGLVGAIGVPSGLDSSPDHMRQPPLGLFLQGCSAAGGLLLVAGLGIWGRLGWTTWQRSRARRLGCCEQCGYDLRGTIAAGRTECPECGASITSRGAPPL